MLMPRRACLTALLLAARSISLRPAFRMVSVVSRALSRTNSICYTTQQRTQTETVMGKSMSNASAWAVGALIGVIVLSTTLGGGVNAQSPKNSPPISNSPPVGAPGGRFQMLIIPPNSNSYGPNDVVILD